MKEKSSLVTWIETTCMNKWINVRRKGAAEYECVKVNNVYPDGYIEVIAEADENKVVFLQLIDGSDISAIAISIDETDVEVPEEA